MATTAFGVTLVTPPAHGTLTTFNPDGSYVYAPATGYVGADSFTYQICQPRNSGNCSNISTVALNVYDPTQACTQGTGPNLLQNPSFVLGNTGFTSGYTFVPTPNSVPSLYNEGTYAIGNNANAYHPDFQGTGHTADNFMMVNGAAALQSVYSQTVTVFPNRFYTISVWAVSVHPSSPAQLGLVVDGKSTSVVTTADTKTTGAVPSVAGPTAILPLSATLSVGANSGVQAAYFTITSLPATGTLTYNGVPVVAGQQIAVASAGSLSSGGLLAYTPAGSCATATFTYTATDNAGNVSTNTATYTIPVTGPVVAVIHAPAGPFCAGASVRLGAGAQPGYSYTWYNGGTIANGAGNILNDSILVATASGTYTVKVASTGCATTSPAFTLTLLPALTAGTIGADQRICAGTTPAPLTSTAGAGGGTGTYTYQWQSSPNNTTWTDISGATVATYAPGPLAATAYFRRRAYSSPCGDALSGVVTITVQPLLATSVALAAPTAQCVGTALTFSPVAANAGTAPTYRWLVNGVAEATATGPTFTSSTLANGDLHPVAIGQRAAGEG
ncbi:MAG: hypothetical protein EOO59_16535, partial [Hymenobacter sp.]